MIKLLKSTRLWVVVAAVASFWLFAPLVTRIEYLFDVMNALSIAVGIGVLIAYAQGIYEALTRETVKGGHWLLIGITVTWVGTVTRHTWNWAWRWLDQPSWMINHHIVAFFVWMIIVGGCFHLTSYRAIEGEIPKENWIRLGLWVGLGLFAGMLVVIFFEQPKFETRAPH